MEKFQSEKYTEKQSEKFEKIIKENGLTDEDPDNFVFHVKNTETKEEKIIRLSKKEKVDVKINEKRLTCVDIEDAVKATKEFPDLPLKEALLKFNFKNSDNTVKYPEIYK